MSRLIATIVLTTLFAVPAAAERYRDAFDYYVLALSWNASWCEAEGDRRGAAQCDPAHEHGWLLHGLWPQYDRGGWPEFCRTPERDPSRSMTAGMEDIMGSGGSAWHQWKKHGRCAGLSAADYYARARTAYGSVERPGLLRELGKDVSIRADVVEEAFLEANPDLAPEDVVVTCRNGRIAEVRVCLTPELAPRACGPDVARRACSRSARLPAIR